MFREVEKKKKIYRSSSESRYGAKKKTKDRIRMVDRYEIDNERAQSLGHVFDNGVHMYLIICTMNYKEQWKEGDRKTAQ